MAGRKTPTGDMGDINMTAAGADMVTAVAAAAAAPAPPPVMPENAARPPAPPPPFKRASGDEQPGRVELLRRSGPLPPTQATPVEELRRAMGGAGRATAGKLSAAWWAW